MKNRKYLYGKEIKNIHGFASNEFCRFNFKNPLQIQFLYLAFETS